MLVSMDINYEVENYAELVQERSNDEFQNDDECCGSIITANFLHS
jgi:hypothetical protein